MPYSDPNRRKAAARTYYHANKDAILERLRQRTPEERARVNERTRERYAADPVLRERANGYSAKWRSRPENGPIIAESQKRYRASPHGRATKRRDILQRYFCLSVEQYDAMLAAQGDTCAICRQPETKVGRVNGGLFALSVDHDHRCCPGKRSCGNCVRGLLCDRCNLGRFPDDPALLRAAADYFERYQEERMTDTREHTETTTETPDETTTERTDTLTNDEGSSVEQTQTVVEPKDDDG